MLPMNKICEDIKAFLIQRDNKNEGKFTVEADETRQTELVLFAHVLSQKYNELVSVKLVESLVVNIQDSIEKDESNAI